MKVDVQKILFVAFLLATCWVFETSAVAIGREESKTIKCGKFECPNGSTCEIKRKPDEDKKSVTITTKCVDKEGKVLNEEKTTENVPHGKTPISSVKRMTVKEDANGTYFGSSYAASAGTFIKKGAGGNESEIDFDPFEGKPEGGFDDMWSIFDRANTFFSETFRRFQKIFWD